MYTYITCEGRCSGQRKREGGGFTTSWPRKRVPPGKHSPLEQKEEADSLPSRPCSVVPECLGILCIEYMYINIYMNICICIYMYIHICVYVCIYIYIACKGRGSGQRTMGRG